MNGKSTTASSISRELAGTLQMARYLLFQRLRRCTNVIIASAQNSDLIDNECLAANISITAPPAWEMLKTVISSVWRSVPPSQSEIGFSTLNRACSPSHEASMPKYI
jgi:hypothetical protein